MTDANGIRVEAVRILRDRLNKAHLEIAKLKQSKLQIAQITQDRGNSEHMLILQIVSISPSPAGLMITVR